LQITLFFTYGVSLKTWAESGLLQREIHLYQELMRQYDIQVNFLTYGDANDNDFGEYLGEITILPIYERMPRYKSKVLSLFQSLFIPWYFRHEIRRSDVIKTNQIWGGWVAVISKFAFHKPLLARCGYDPFMNSISSGMNSFKRSIVWTTSKFLYKYSDHIWLNTEEISDFVQVKYGISSNKITVIPNWIDTSKFRPNRINKSISMDRVLFVGRLSEEKNIHLLLLALDGTGVGLDIVGDGGLKFDISQMARKLDIDVNFLGRLSNNQMPDIYNHYQAYVLCSAYEGNPKTLLEAMSCGCVVIGTNVLGIQNIIQNNKNGKLVEEDPVHLRRAIVEVLGDRSLLLSLGGKARDQIVKNNSLESFVREEWFLYKRLSNHAKL
jgi:glycosyltransferase involved in cell wall biosynthesis